MPSCRARCGSRSRRRFRDSRPGIPRVNWRRSRQCSVTSSFIRSGTSYRRLRNRRRCGNLSRRNTAGSTRTPRSRLPSVAAGRFARSTSDLRHELTPPAATWRLEQRNCRMRRRPGQCCAPATIPGVFFRKTRSKHSCYWKTTPTRHRLIANGMVSSCSRDRRHHALGGLFPETASCGFPRPLVFAAPFAASGFFRLSAGSSFSVPFHGPYAAGVGWHPGDGPAEKEKEAAHGSVSRRRGASRAAQGCEHASSRERRREARRRN